MEGEGVLGRRKWSVALAVLLGLAIFAPAGAAASPDHSRQAVAAKGSCDAKCKKRRRAERRRATRFLAGTTVSRTINPDPSSTFSQSIDFCLDGTLSERAGTTTSTGSTGQSWKADWRVGSVTGHKAIRTADIVESNIRDYASPDGAPPPPAVFSFSVGWSAFSPVIINSFEWTHAAGVC
jgi:hypothetical protein